MKIKSFMAHYYSDGWDVATLMLDKEINTWIDKHPSHKIENIEHVKFDTHEAVHIWYSILENE